MYKFQIPIRYGITWDATSAPNGPTREGLETDLLNAVMGMAKACGATDVEVMGVEESPERDGKVLTLGTAVDFDFELFSTELRRAVDTQHDDGE